jgi:hypothetical protein
MHSDHATEPTWQALYDIAEDRTYRSQTALALHGVSDVLPAKIHLTLPLSWRRRRFRGEVLSCTMRMCPSASARG